MASTTVLIDFIESLDEVEVIRHEIDDAAFRALRRCVWRLSELFIEDDETAATGELLRRTLMVWLTAPVDFSALNTEFLERCGTADSVRRRYGVPAGEWLDGIRSNLSDLVARPSTLRAAVTTALTEELHNGRRVRVHCHRTVRSMFQSLADSGNEVPNPMDFVHTPADYRACSIVDTLVHVGPMRSRGYASIPPAVLNAPRHRRIMQFVWAGLHDEAEFGGDLVLDRLRLSQSVESGGRVRTSWRTERVMVGASPHHHSFPDEPIDELALYSNRAPPTDTRSAVLISLPDGTCVFCPPSSRPLVLRRIEERLRVVSVRAAEIESGDFLVRSYLEDSALGGATAREGQYSRLWKERLAERAKSSMEDLRRRLEAAGVERGNLTHAINYWRKPATSVIHAPKNEADFARLISELGIEADTAAYARPAGSAWWKLAWREVRRSRGEAIQFGLLEHELVSQSLLRAVESYCETNSLDGDADVFEIDLTKHSEIDAKVSCRRVLAVDDGYRVPSTEVDAILPLEEAERWRA